MKCPKPWAAAGKDRVMGEGLHSKSQKEWGGNSSRVDHMLSRHEVLGSTAQYLHYKKKKNLERIFHETSTNPGLQGGSDSREGIYRDSSTLFINGCHVMLLFLN